MSELLVLASGLWFLAGFCTGPRQDATALVGRRRLLLAACFLTSPVLIMLDHVHFQVPCCAHALIAV